MNRRSIAAVAAIVVGLATLGLSLRCDTGAELVVGGSALVGLLAAIWNDNSERSIGDRIAKLLIVVFIAGMTVFFFVLIVHANRCA